jgi:integrase
MVLALALHTGQRQADIRKLAWSQYDGRSITLQQRKSRRLGGPARVVRIPCTKALKVSLDSAERRATVVLATKTGLAFQKRYLERLWEETCSAGPRRE